MMIEGYEVTGWMAEETKTLYSDFVQHIDSPANHEQSSFLELGVAYGKSIIYMAEQVRLSGKSINVWAVDIWSNASCFHKFRQNLYNHSVENIVKPIKTPSWLAACGFADKSLDGVMIDSSHKFEDTILDIESWLPKLKKNGRSIMLFDDVHLKPVERAIDETLGLSNPNLERIGRCARLRV